MDFKLLLMLFIYCKRCIKYFKCCQLHDDQLSSDNTLLLNTKCCQFPMNLLYTNAVSLVILDMTSG